MKKLKSFTLGVMAVTTLIACSSNVENFTQYKPLQEELKNAPDWVKNPIGKFEAKASAKMINDEIELARTEAIMRAKARLAERIKSAIIQEIEDTQRKKLKNGNGYTKQDLKINSNYYVNMALIDVREEKIWISKKGNVWVLLKANPEIVKIAVKKALLEYSGNSYQLDDE